MLAEATSNADVVTWGIILVITTIGANIAVIIGTRRTQKREVSFGFIPASKDEFDRHVADNKSEHENLFSKLGGVERGSGAKISGEVTAIHTRINVIEKSNGRLEATTEFQSQQLAQIDAKITRLLERKHES